MTEPSVCWRELFVPSYLLSLLLVCLAVMLHAADATLVATLSPAIVHDIGGIELMSWSVSLYEVGSIVAAAASGLLSLRLGLGRTMSMAALVFAAGCLISAVAPSMPVLLLGRLLQGAGGGGLIALAFVSVGVLFPRRLMPRALAVVSMVWGASAFMGPLIGGVLVMLSSWRWAFGLFCAAAVLLALWIALVFTRHQSTDEAPESTMSGANPFPVRRLSWLAGGVLLISVAGLVLHAVLTPLLLLFGLLAIVRFFLLDAAQDSTRMFPRGTTRLSHPVGGALLMILSFGVATIAISIYGPLLMTSLYGISLLTAGYVVACSSIGWSIAAIAFSGLPERYDRRMILFGMLSLTVSVIGFIVAVPHGPLWLIAVLALLEGAGFGMAWTFILRRALQLVEDDDTERLASSIATAHRLGFAIGAAVMGVVANIAGIDNVLVSTAEHTVPNARVVSVASWLFIAGLPFAMMGLLAMRVFLRPVVTSSS